MTPKDRKQYVADWKERNDATYAEIADLVGVSVRTVQSWVDHGEHGRVPSETAVKLLQVHDNRD